LWQLPNTVAATNNDPATGQESGTQHPRWGGLARSRCVRTIEVGDGVGDGHGCADALAAAGHVLAEQKLREPLLHQLQLCARHVDRFRVNNHGRGRRYTVTDLTKRDRSRYVPSSVDRRSSTSARGFMLSRLSAASFDAGDRPISLAAAAPGSNGPLWSTLLHCSEKEKDVDTSETVRLRLPAASTRLRIDADRHPPCSPAVTSELSSDTETDGLPLSMAAPSPPLASRLAFLLPPELTTAQDKATRKELYRGLALFTLLQMVGTTNPSKWEKPAHQTRDNSQVLNLKRCVSDTNLSTRRPLSKS
jgi:hypothetical protein